MRTKIHLRIISPGIRAMCLGIAMSACADLTKQPLPAGILDPASYHTREGALGMRVGALNQLANAYPGFVVNTGLLTDELQVRETGSSSLQGTLSSFTMIDSRAIASLQGLGADSYGDLHRVRANVSQALGALRAYYPDASPALRGEMYAVAGFAEIMLADLFCSGVPLTTYNFDADFTYRPSSSTADVYRSALAKFDTALALSQDSVRIMNLARVGKARVLLNLAKYEDAAAVAAEVPDGYRYVIATEFGNLQTGAGNPADYNAINIRATISNNEGINGLPYRSGDSRTTDTTLAMNTSGQPITFPRKYNVTGYTLFPVADWIEARLIRAEAALRAGHADVWLDHLNYLREHATVSGMTGTLSPLQDPGVDSARVSLLFSERAFWLFLTGHRQGDLRRMIRQYPGRGQERVYPTGPYYAPGAVVYGTDVTVPIPESERRNPYFKGCLNRDA